MTGTILVERTVWEEDSGIAETNMGLEVEGGEEESGLEGIGKGMEARIDKGVSIWEGIDGIGQEEERKDGRMKEVRSGRVEVELISGRT